MEALTEDGAFSVDVLIHKDRIALEVRSKHTTRTLTIIVTLHRSI